MEMEANTDLHASMAHAAAGGRADPDKSRKALASLTFEATIEHDGKVLVLYRLKEGGLDRYMTRWLEKKSDDRYYRTYVATYGWRTATGDKKRISDRIRQWERKGKP